MGIGRKLEEIRQELALLGEQGKTRGFFNNVENAEKLDGLVEDLRDVMIDYQVRALNNVSFSRLTFCRLLCNRTCTTKASYSSLVSSHYPLLFWLGD